MLLSAETAAYGGHWVERVGYRHVGRRDRRVLRDFQLKDPRRLQQGTYAASNEGLHERGARAKREGNR